MDGFMVVLGRGVDPSTPQTRPQPPTAADIAQDAKAAATFAMAEAEVARVARQTTADKAASEAKLAQEAAAAATVLAEKAAAEAALYTNPVAGGSTQPPAGGAVVGIAIQPLVSAILQGVGMQAPATLPWWCMLYQN